MMFKKTSSQTTTQKTAGFLARSSTSARSSVGFKPTEGPPSWRQRLDARVSSATFELTMAAIILMNTIVMAVEVQYRGLLVGHVLNYHSVKVSAEACQKSRASKWLQETWPHAEGIFFGLEICFGVVFTLVSCPF